MRKFFLLSLFTILILFSFISLKTALALPFSSAYLRLANQGANVALSGTVCSNPSSPGAGTENSVAITFPSTFSISSTASNWTTNTSNLPTGASAWPGIGASATGVSGKTVTFSSSDLTSNTLYCFNFAGASSTTGSAGTDKNGFISTKNSSSTTIDSTSYSVSIVLSSQINITASVDPQVSDLPIAIESLTSGTTFPQETTIEYKITYGNATSSTVPLTIQAEWSQGTISGNSIPSVDILDYVIGSSSNAYNSTPAVVDTINRTITWTIPSIPASTTGQTVTFKLKTSNSYTGSSLVSFDVLGRSISGSTTTPDVKVTKNYQYKSVSVTSTPTPTPSSVTSTPTPTTIPEILEINNVSIRSVSSDKADIAISTNKNAVFTLSYGTTVSSLSKTIKTLIPEAGLIISLSDLDSDTIYYFKVTATDENNESVTSDIFTFRTAITSPIPSVDTQSIIVTSSNNILLSSQIKKGYDLKENIVILPRQAVFTIQFSLNKNISLKSIQAIIRDRRVLGFSTLDEVTAGTNYVNLVEVQPGIYTGKIATPDTEGKYDVYVRLIDFNGNILEQRVLNLSVTNKFKVLVKGTDTPVENARVLLYLYNQGDKTYSVISPQILPIQNPAYSTPDGRYNITLPFGRYKADVSAIGYNPQTVEFEINQYSEGYPVIYLERNFSIINTLEYYLDTLTDAINESQDYLKQRADSNRLFDLSTFGAIFIFIIISILSISARTHIGVIYLPYFLLFKVLLLFRKNTGMIIFGKILENDTKFPISRANVYLLSSDEKQMIAALKTNKLGEFYFNNYQALDLKIKIEKEGFQAPQTYEYINSKIKEIPIVFLLKHAEKPTHSMFEVIVVYIEDFLGMCMEAFVLFGLLVQIYFTFTFGFMRVLPFIIITILNSMLIFLYLYKPRGLEK